METENGNGNQKLERVVNCTCSASKPGGGGGALQGGYRRRSFLSLQPLLTHAVNYMYIPELREQSAD